MARKVRQLRFEVKDAEKGQVEAVISVFGEIDHDGDVSVPGAFQDGAEVVISAYGHGSWRGEMPVGKGVIRVSEKDARLQGEYFLNTDSGREHFEVAKALGPLQEWSYGYDVLKCSFGERDGRYVRFLEELKVHEACQVLKGAGLNTRTVDVKEADAPAAPEPTGGQLAAQHAATRELLRFEKTRARLIGG